MFVLAYYVKDHLLTYIYCLVIVAKGKFNQNHANCFRNSHLVHRVAEEHARDSIRLPNYAARHCYPFYNWFLVLTFLAKRWGKLWKETEVAYFTMPTQPLP
jgi:hypothetical protein